jgi:hypothetical protein
LIVRRTKWWSLFIDIFIHVTLCSEKREGKRGKRSVSIAVRKGQNSPLNTIYDTVQQSGGRRERCIYINGEGESRGFPYLKHAQLVLSFVNL